MRFDRFTIRGQEAVQEAIGAAEKNQNQQVEPEHLLAAMLERLTEQAFLNGFHRVILMGDHAGGQPEVYEEVAKKLNARYGALRVFYCDQVYRPANDAFDQYLAQHGYPLGLHGYLFDTSEMMYLDKDNTWVRRDLVSSAVGDPVVDGKVQIGPQSPYNGIQGDARRSTVELGKRAVDMKVDYAVRQIRSLLPDLSGGGAALPSGNSTAATSRSPARSRLNNSPVSSLDSRSRTLGYFSVSA